MKWLGMFLIVGACGSTPVVPSADESAVAVAYLARFAGGVEDDIVGQAGARPAPERTAPRVDETGGLLSVSATRIAELRTVAADERALAAFLRAPISRDDFEALVWLRSPDVAAARADVAAARTGYQQSTDLQDLVAQYRSFLRETKTRVGPQRSRRATGAIAPAPNIDALSGELVARKVSVAQQAWRRTVRDVVAAAERAHADGVRLLAMLDLVNADVVLHESLVRIVEARLESGQATQAALLTFRARLESLRTSAKVLVDEQAGLRARWNRLLDRAENAPVNLRVVSDAVPAMDAGPDADAWVALGLREQQAVRIAALRVDMGAIAVRLAETMTLPRLDLGSSRLERERAGEAGVQRGMVFPEPGRMSMPRAEFGVREAQIAEMRARLESAQRQLESVRAGTQQSVRAALVAMDTAHRRYSVLHDDIVPLATRALDSTRGSYEGNRASYIELLDNARRLLRARQDLVSARRDFAHARAQRLRAVGVRAPDMRNIK